MDEQDKVWVDKLRDAVDNQRAGCPILGRYEAKRLLTIIASVEADIAFLLAVVAAADTLCADVKTCHAYGRTSYLRKDVADYESALEAANG